MTPKKIPTLYTGHENFDGSYEEYESMEGTSIKNTLPVKDWLYCADGKHAYLIIKGIQIPLTDPKQRRGKNYQIYICEFLSSPGREFISQAEFESKAEQEGDNDYTVATFRDAIRGLNKKVKEGFESKDDFIVPVDHGYAVNRNFGQN